MKYLYWSIVILCGVLDGWMNGWSICIDGVCIFVGVFGWVDEWMRYLY